jgi:short-subunit dehydrogenase
MEKEVALITGGTSGIGAAFARYFAGQGYDLIITGRPDDKIYPCVEKLTEKYNVNVEIIFVELANQEDVLKVEDIIRGTSRIGILINNAGFGLGKPFWQDKIDNLDAMIKVHINAPVRFIHAALPNMINRKKGLIINLSSLSSFIPIPRDSVYSATKLFQNSFMESLHICFKDMGIKMQVLCPGFVRTDFHKIYEMDTSGVLNNGIIPWMKPDEVVKISIRNLERKNKLFVIPGFWNKVVKFIYFIMPSPIYYRLAKKFLI